MLSLIFALISFFLIKNLKTSVDNKINEHLQKLEEEKKFVLILNERTFEHLTAYCFYWNTKENLNSYFSSFNTFFEIDIKCNNNNREYSFKSLANYKKVYCKNFNFPLYSIKVCLQK
jgi:hypothetical protein